LYEAFVNHSWRYRAAASTPPFDTSRCDAERHSMKYRFSLAIGFALFLAPSISAQVNSDKAQLTELETRIADAVVRHDTKFLAAIYSDGFVRTDPSSGELNKEPWLARLKSNLDKIEFISVTDITVRFFGATAIVTGRMTTRGRNPETDANQQYQRLDRFTHTFVKQNGRWEMVASHASIIAAYGIHTDY
jgi:ketosteroid isomerase-like protein